MAATDAPDDELDSFERSRRVMGLSVVTDPYPEFATLRAEHVAVEDLSGLAGDGTGAAAEPLVVYTAASYDAVFEVLRDGRRFSNAGYADVIGPLIGRTILQMDGSEHHAYRSLISQAFRRKAVDEWEADVVRPIVDRAIDEFASDGRAELVRQLTFPFPVNVIAELLGLPRNQLSLFHRLTIELISVDVDAELASRASVELAELLQPLVDARRRSPEDDLVSLLTQAEHDRHRLTDEEIIAFCRMLLPAGAETTYRSSSNLLVGLLTHTDQLDAVRADRSLIPQAIEEGLRWECPLLTIFRTATEDTEVCGVPIPAGAPVVINIGSANHDERRWDHPERFDIFRPPHPCLTFASGPHTCLGMHLARAETRVVLDRLLDRLPNLRLDPDAEPPAITGRTFRSPSEIRVVFDPPPPPRPTPRRGAVTESSSGPTRPDEPIEIAGDVAHPARVYNYVRGGTDNFAADRKAAEHAAAAGAGGLDHARAAVSTHQVFLRRVVHYLVAEAGIRQFLDIGTPIPNPDSIHEIAQQIAPDSRAVYVNNDAVVLAHAHTLRKSTPEGATAYIDGDPRAPEKFLPHVPMTLDLSQPVGVMLMGILHHICDEDDPYGIVDRLLEAVPSGSHLVISHLTNDILTEEVTEAAERMNQWPGFTLILRTHAEVFRFFDGLEMVEPGVVLVDRWRPPETTPTASEEWPTPYYGAVGRKP